jgi:hypothetical protein
MHGSKAYGGVDIYLHIFLASEPEGANGELHPSLPIQQKAGRTPELMTNSLRLPVIEVFLGRKAPRLDTIPTELFRQPFLL